jgi:Glycosyl hydrolase family 71
MHSSIILFVLTLFTLTFGYVIPHRHLAQHRRRQLLTVEAQAGPTIITLTPAKVQATPAPDSPQLSTVALPAPSATQAPASSGKLVVAHHMVGNTFPYTKQDWAEDIQLAHAAGIDGFALNTGREDWEPARVADAYVPL